MRDTLGMSLRNLKRNRIRKKLNSFVLLILSLLVTVDVFWALRQPGWTLAGDAGCGILEHTHDASCFEGDTGCEYEEHVHSIACYSDETADTETMLDWQQMFSNYPYTGNLRDDLVGIAKTQVGYTESQRNFSVGQDGIRRGYTRYGAWYGTPYRDWSAMFVSFCLHYAGADPEKTPGNTGAASMIELWNALGKYEPAGTYVPSLGDLVFFTDNAVGIVAEVQSATCYVIRGDLEDAVCSTVLYLNDSSILGWGITEEIALAEDPSEAEDAFAEESFAPEQETDPLPESEESPLPEPEELTPPETEEPPLPEPEDLTPPETEEPPLLEPEDLIPPETEELAPSEAEEPSQTENAQQDTVQEDHDPPASVPEAPDLLNISNGPAFFIFEGRSATPQMQRFSMRNTRTITDILPYLDSVGGSYFFTLLDLNNEELPKDDQGNYIALANTGYKLTISFHSPNGFLPGTYQYQVPNGLLVDGGEGTFILSDKTNVGGWVVTDTGLITLTFNENMNSRSEITISSTLGIHFPEEEQPIDFDGLISVKVEPPVHQESPTVLSKWGSTSNKDSTKINWTVRIDGHSDSQIPGNILTDQAMVSDWTRPHSYTESDIAGGLSFGVSDPAGEWHNWHVSIGDPHLIWDETGWSYKIPKTVTCDYCGELELGNEGWVYLVNYTSTPTQLNTPGTFDYENKVTIDGQTARGWSNFTHGEALAEIKKEGSFISDAAGGFFLWEIRTVIPGRIDGQQAKYSWFIMDEMKLLDDGGHAIGRVQNDVHLSMVTATYNGTTIQIPRIQDATDQDMFAWDNSWTATENGISHTRTINLLCRCQCTEESCRWTSCGDYWFVDDDGAWKSNGFCQCWTETQNMVFTFIYKTTDMSILETYGTLGYQVNNHAQLYYMPDSDQSVRVSYDDASVTIPNLFEKKLTHDFDGYTANYRITVNEAKVALTNGTPLYIHDVMTDTLAFISGSLVITAEDVNGNITTLQQGTDFTVTYDGTGNQTDTQGNEVHVLDIEILHPQPVMYILDYDATLVLPEHVTGGIKYRNSATIYLWGKSITDTSTEKVHSEINIAAKSYKVEMFKTCALTNEPLPGATFGLYNEEGGLITSDVTDNTGRLLFQTNVAEGIIFREHVLYYMQELRAPSGYQLDSTKYWFCFCNEAGDSCRTCAEILEETDAARIPFEQIGMVHVTNQLMDYDLPATGGAGVYPLILVSVMFIVTPLVYELFRRRKQERRGAG